MPVLYPISYLTKSVKSILTLFLSEVTIISHEPHIFSKDPLKVNPLFPQEILPDLSNINLSPLNTYLDNIRDVYLPDAVQSVFSTEDVKQIREKIINLQDANSKYDIKSILTIYRLFYEYDKNIDETNREYESFLKKFKSFQEILNSPQDVFNQEDTIQLIHEEFKLIKPFLRLKIWLILFSTLNHSVDLLIGVSRDIAEILIDKYFMHTKEMPKLILSLNCEGISYSNLKHRDYILNLFNEIMYNHSTLIKDINKLKTSWEELYKPKRDSSIRINFYDFSGVSIETLLSDIINKPISINNSNSIQIFIE